MKFPFDLIGQVLKSKPQSRQYSKRVSMLFLYYSVYYVLNILFYLVLCFVALIVFGKLYFEPIKGVCKCKTKLHGKIALVTGGNSGIGLETVRDLATRGARVIIACRDEKKAKAAIEDIICTSGNSNVEFWYLDLFKPSCIREFAEKFNRTFDRLDILVNNAGVAGTKPRLAENGVELVMQVNYIGPFLLTQLLMNKLEAARPSRIVIVSSKLHYFAKLDMNDLVGVKTDGHIKRYANSKLCNVLWAKALVKRLPEGITANSLHPGVVQTDIFKRMGQYLKLVKFIIDVLFKSAKEGAQTSIHLCVAPELEGCSGGYYSECKLREFYRVAQDDDLTEKLWTESMRLAEL